jgi:hypothetical protein
MQSLDSVHSEYAEPIYIRNMQSLNSLRLGEDLKRRRGYGQQTLKNKKNDPSHVQQGQHEQLGGRSNPYY